MFTLECRVNKIEKIYPGLSSLIQIAYGTSHEDIENAIDTYSNFTKMIQSIQKMKSQDQLKPFSDIALDNLVETDDDKFDLNLCYNTATKDQKS